MAVYKSYNPIRKIFKPFPPSVMSLYPKPYTLLSWKGQFVIHVADGRFDGTGPLACLSPFSVDWLIESFIIGALKLKAFISELDS